MNEFFIISEPHNLIGMIFFAIKSIKYFKIPGRKRLKAAPELTTMIIFALLKKKKKR